MTRRIGIRYRALLNYPVWYALAWDLLRDEVRTFRCDRIERAHLLDDEFRVLPYTRFEKAMEGVDAVRP